MLTQCTDFIHGFFGGPCCSYTCIFLFLCRSWMLLSQLFPMLSLPSDYHYMIGSSVSHLLLIIILNSPKQIHDFEKRGVLKIGHISCCELCCTKRGPTLRTPSGSATSFVIQANNQDITCFVPAKVLIRWLMANTTGCFCSL